MERGLRARARIQLRFKTPLVHVTGRRFFNYCCVYYIELVLISFRANKGSCLSLAKAREVLIPVYSSLCPFLCFTTNQFAQKLIFWPTCTGYIKELSGDERSE